MIMSYIWTGLVAISILCAILSGQGTVLGASVLQGAQAGVQLVVSLAGSICLWSGLGKLLEHGKITTVLSKVLSPILQKLFPSSKTDAILAGYLSANICANILGLGNAATLMGINAAKRLAKTPVASDELCRLIVLNTASIQLIPTNVVAIRAEMGAKAPFDILPAVWITSICSAGCGLAASYIFHKVWPHD